MKNIQRGSLSWDPSIATIMATTRLKLFLYILIIRENCVFQYAYICDLLITAFLV